MANDLLKQAQDFADELQRRTVGTGVVSIVVVLSSEQGWASSVRGEYKHALISLTNALVAHQQDGEPEAKA